MIGQVSTLVFDVLAQNGAFSDSLLYRFVLAGGWVTCFVLVPLSVLVTTLIIHLAIVVRRSAQAPPGLARALVGAARNGQTRQIAEITRDDETMLGHATYAGVVHAGAGRDAARAAVDQAVEERASRLFRRIEYLNLIGNISPMIGLIGTVKGMIGAFARIYRAAGGMPDAGRLAGDISEALVNTLWGLGIAVFALSLFAVFRNRIDAYASECVKLCEGIISLVSQQQATSGTADTAPTRLPARD